MISSGDQLTIMDGHKIGLTFFLFAPSLLIRGLRSKMPPTTKLVAR